MNYKLSSSVDFIIRLDDGAHIPADTRNTDYAAYQAWLADGNMPEPADVPPAPTPQDQVKANTQAIQAELDRQAALKGYDNIISACTYAMQPDGAPFQAEGAAFVTWRSAVWSQAYAVLAKVQAGQQTMPTPEEAVAQMPALVLPA